MKSIVGTVLLAVTLCVPVFGWEGSFGGVQLLDSYTARRRSAADAMAWTIQGKSGLIIHCESGSSEGRAVNLMDKEKYTWYREQTVNGHKVLLALIKPGLKTDPDLDAQRNLPRGIILLVTFPLGGHRDHAATFVGKIANQEMIADASDGANVRLPKGKF